jgi:hypothetical protein
MVQTCRSCSRLNPAEAAFCFYDGTALPGRGRHAAPVAPGTQRFPNPFIFPSGRACGSFDELALACREYWDEACKMLRQGYLERFLGGLGRGGLALAAREAARFPDRHRGLDQFLARLPTTALRPPRLRVEPPQVNLGTVRVGEDRDFTLRLRNDGCACSTAPSPATTASGWPWATRRGRGARSST